MARPCFHCLEVMKAVNIRYCYYSTFQGDIIREKVCNMISIQLSNNTKRNLDFIYNNNNTLSKMLYYEKIMQDVMIQPINKLSLDNFIKYNWELLFPSNYYYIITKNKITFFNNENIIITNCLIIS